MSAQKHQDYIKQHLQSLLNDFASAALSSLPSDIHQFALNWFQSRKKPELSLPEQEELKHLRNEIEKIRAGHNPDQDTEVESVSSSGSDDIVEDFDLLPPVNKKYRTSVSAEAYGQWNRKSDFNPRQISKTNEQRQRITEVINKCFMFSSLDKVEKEILILAFEERKYEPGSDIIVQGDDGNELFVVDSGELSCFKRFGQDTEAKFIKSYGAGDAFGELALLYNVPRAASIKANTEVICWVLDRDCFNNIVKEAARIKRETYEQFLATVQIFKEIDVYERSQMADALQTVDYNDGEFVIRQGEWGDVFYLIEEGEAIATKTLVPGTAPEKVFEYKVGGYFGELALIKGAPRAANVIAKGQLKCAIMDRRAFKRLLGPLEDIMKRNASEYEGYKF